MSTLTVYPDADPETSTVDGGTRRTVSAPGESWASIISGAGVSANYPADNSAYGPLYVETGTTGWKQLGRLIWLFDTSALTSGAKISAATFSIYGKSKAGDFTTSVLNAFAMSIVSSNPASNTATAAGDYTSFGSTKFCDTDITYSSWNESGYNDYSFNASGVSAISKTSITKLGGRLASDISGTQTHESGKYFLMEMYFADQTGTDKDPKQLLLVQLM
jgi:hypothetical protein